MYLFGYCFIFIECWIRISQQFPDVFLVSFLLLKRKYFIMILNGWGRPKASPPRAGHCTYFYLPNIPHVAYLSDFLIAHHRGGNPQKICLSFGEK